MFSRKRSYKSNLSGSMFFKCEICEKEFNKTYNYKTHMLTHSSIKEFKCDICDKEFTLKSNLKKHELTHLDIKNYKCDICEREFTQKSNLNTHMLTHSGRKDFQCEICEKEFTQRKNLKTHLFAHSGRRKFKCEICEKIFTSKGNLERHLLTHIDRKDFKCEICGRKFTQSGNLKRHMAQHPNQDAQSSCQSITKSSLLTVQTDSEKTKKRSIGESGTVGYVKRFMDEIKNVLNINEKESDTKHDHNLLTVEKDENQEIIYVKEKSGEKFSFKDEPNDIQTKDTNFNNN